MDSPKRPVLTSRQLELFIFFLKTSCGLKPHEAYIDSPRKAYQVFTKHRSVILSVVNQQPDFYKSIVAICNLYQDYEKSLNCGSELMAVDSNLVINPEPSLMVQDSTIQKKPHKKARGKQKSPTMKHYKVRLPVDMLQRLGSLDGMVSQHIRHAISQYLDSV